MKIIQITSYYPPRIGGMQNTVREISERLARRGHDIEVYTSDIEIKNHRLKSKKNLKINYLRGFNIANTAIIPSLFFRLLKIPKNSLMHVHTPRPFTAEVTYLISKIRNIPYVAHVHGDVEPSGKFGFLLPIYKKYLWKIVLRNAKRVICLSEGYEKFVNKRYGVTKILIVPNGVNEKFFIKRIKSKNKITQLLFVGRLAKEKNLPRLIEAHSLMKQPAILHIVGEGNKKEEIIKLINDKKLNNVFVHGKKTGKGLLDFYRNADVFVLSSNYEGLPLTVLEAMAAGVPVVASDVIGIQELVRNIGILVSPPTPQNFAKELDKLINNKKLMVSLAKRGREKARQYNWDTAILQLEDLYQALLREVNE